MRLDCTDIAIIWSFYGFECLTQMFAHDGLFSIATRSTAVIYQRFKQPILYVEVRGRRIVQHTNTCHTTINRAVQSDNYSHE